MLTHETECHSYKKPRLLPFQSREPPPPSTSLGTKKKIKVVEWIFFIFILTNPLHHPLLFYSNEEKYVRLYSVTWGWLFIKGVIYTEETREFCFPPYLKFHFSFHTLHSNWLNSFHCLIQTTFFWLILQSIGRTRKPVTARRVFQFINFWHIRNHRSVANWKNVCPYENDAERFLYLLLHRLFFSFSEFFFS